MAILAVVSILLIAFDFAHELDLNTEPFKAVNNGILVIFTVDYFTRFFLAKDKKKFFKHNIFDLLSIIPVGGLVGIFRWNRIGRAFTILRIARLVGLTGRLNKFIEKDGLLYYIYVTCTVLLISAAMYSVSEKTPFSNALWWAITTASTVGYGDISPKTTIGRIAGVLLMLVGIGLIGVITSTITDYFSQEDNNQVQDKLDVIEKENRELRAELKKLNEHLAKIEKKSE
ncbi:ion transporter [Limosilactobacillus sp. Sa3CUN2]|uniref:Ion transporter n=2 Tax=Limosilactobacillus avistercoris TaxID=2762243 RepID=A0ABR8PD98_9LACO|nr:ion transporter [Limosilactobacillus avistercoris]MBD7895257.1 ion transporter [Limosilactobacillus avistercoris]